MWTGGLAKLVLKEKVVQYKKALKIMLSSNRYSLKTMDEYMNKGRRVFNWFEYIFNNIYSDNKRCACQSLILLFLAICRRKAVIFIF